MLILLFLFFSSQIIIARIIFLVIETIMSKLVMVKMVVSVLDLIFKIHTYYWQCIVAVVVAVDIINNIVNKKYKS